MAALAEAASGALVPLLTGMVGTAGTVGALAVGASGGSLVGGSLILGSIEATRVGSVRAGFGAAAIVVLAGAAPEMRSVWPRRIGSGEARPFRATSSPTLTL